MQVLWVETGSLFPGVIEAVNESSFEVLYDELVQGLPCRERNIAKSRLKAIHVRNNRKRNDMNSTHISCVT